MERISREQQHLGTHQTIARSSIVKGVSLSSPSGTDKNSTDSMSKSFPSFHIIPQSKLEFHPYAYIDFYAPSSFPQTSCLYMSDISINTSNKSPTTTPPQSPVLPIPPHLPTFPIPFNPVASAIAPSYPPLSPQTAINVLATQLDLNDTIQAIAYGLISTVHNRGVAHALQSKGLQDTNMALQERIKALDCEAD